MCFQTLTKAMAGQAEHVALGVVLGLAEAPLRNEPPPFVPAVTGFSLATANAVVVVHSKVSLRTGLGCV